jgi:hypothetical protein
MICRVRYGQILFHDCLYVIAYPVFVQEIFNYLVIQGAVIRSYIKAGCELKRFQFLGEIFDCPLDTSLAFDMGTRGCQMRGELIKEHILGLMQCSLGGISPRGKLMPVLIPGITF